MEDLSALLLELYRAAQASPAEEFPDFALGLLQGLLPFDSARVLLRTEKNAGGLAVQGVHLYNEPESMVLDWVSINHLDPILRTVVAHPGRAWRAHCPTLFAGPGMSVMRDYVRRYRHENAMVVAYFPSDAGTRRDVSKVLGVSLYRADPDDQFTAKESPLLVQLAPHLLEALAINRSLALSALDADSRRGGVAIVRAEGLLSYCDAALQGLLREEWQDWQGPRLPKPLWQSLARSPNAGYQGAAVRFTATRIGELLFLRGERLSRLARLSPREADIARFYGAGKSYKEIAQQTNLSPATVRNYLARVYAKLEIGGKAELANLLALFEAGGGY